MTRIALAGLLALPALFLTSNSASAQCFGGCNVCMTFGNRLHMHGPLYNYTPGYGGGYGCGSGYGCGYGCNSGSNRWPMSRGWAGSNCGTGHCGGGLFSGGLGLFHHNSECSTCGYGGWGHYAVSTFRNVFHRVHPFASRCGNTCSVGCGVSGGCQSCGGAAAAVNGVNTAPPAVMPAPVK